MATVDMNMYGLGDSMWQAEKVPPGVQNQIEMEDRRLRKRQNDSLSEATSALLNSEGKVMKPEIERKEDNKDRIGQDLDQSLHTIQSCAQNDLESMQDPEEILNLLKPWIENSSGMSIFPLQTNLYQRNVTHTVVMNASSALDFLRERKSRSRSYSRSQLHTKRAPVYVQEEIDLEKKAAKLFNMTEPIHKKHLDLTESTNVEMKFFSTRKALQRIKEIVARSVSAFGNTDGGYLFVGLNAQEIERSGPERKQRYFSKIESEIEKHISRLPVYHFCKEKAKINYSCKFLEVHDEGGLHRYFCALHVERFCCAVFAKEPVLLVKKKPVLYLTKEERIKYITDAKQGGGRGISNEHTFGQDGWEVLSLLFLARSIVLKCQPPPYQSLVDPIRSSLSLVFLCPLRRHILHSASTLAPASSPMLWSSFQHNDRFLS
ncbi:Hypothetical predicted protein [Marmota monax]|nr:hypothetical protein GHT09_011530 [Marmota monax]VTJ59294.1 Hypothetical predicted protein [Marmota monax]